MAVMGPQRVTPGLVLGSVVTLAVAVLGVVAVLQVVGDDDTNTSAIGSDVTSLPTLPDSSGSAGSGPGAEGGGPGEGPGATASLAPGGPSTSPTTSRATSTSASSTTTTEVSTTTEASTTSTTSSEDTTSTSTSSSTSTTEVSTTTSEGTTSTSASTTTEVSTTSEAPTTTLGPMAVAMSRSTCPMLRTCSYSLQGSGATANGELALVITNGDGVDIQTLDGFGYDPRLRADADGGFTAGFETLLGSADTHTFLVTDVATGRSASDSIRFRLFG